MWRLVSAGAMNRKAPALAVGREGLHKSAQDRLIDVVLRAQSHVLQRIGDRGAERGGAGWPRAITRPRLPQIRTCPIKAFGSSV